MTQDYLKHHICLEQHHKSKKSTLEILKWYKKPCVELNCSLIHQCFLCPLYSIAHFIKNLNFNDKMLRKDINCINQMKHHVSYKSGWRCMKSTKERHFQFLGISNRAFIVLLPQM